MAEKKKDIETVEPKNYPPKEILQSLQNKPDEFCFSTKDSVITFIKWKITEYKI